MQLRPFSKGLQPELEEIAVVGDDAVAEAARRLTAAVSSGAGGGHRVQATDLIGFGRS